MEEETSQADEGDEHGQEDERRPAGHGRTGRRGVVTGETTGGEPGNDQKPEIAHSIEWLGPETGVLPTLAVSEDLLAPTAHAGAPRRKEVRPLSAGLPAQVNRQRVAAISTA